MMLVQVRSIIHFSYHYVLDVQANHKEVSMCSIVKVVYMVHFIHSVIYYQVMLCSILTHVVLPGNTKGTWTPYSTLARSGNLFLIWTTP